MDRHQAARYIGNPAIDSQISILSSSAEINKSVDYICTCFSHFEINFLYFYME